MRKSKRAIAFIAVGVLLLCGAAGWFLKNTFEDGRAGDFAKKAVAEIKNTVPEYSADTALSEPRVTVDGNVYCGRIIIKKAGIELPVFADWKEGNLNYAPCRYSGSHLSDDLIIAAHNYKSHFRDLGSVTVGDSVVFADAAGEENTYVVREIVRLDGTAVGDMYAGEWDMTLFTCTPGGKQRLTLRCERV